MKKLIAILLVLVMAVAMVACAQTNDGEKTIAVIAMIETKGYTT